MSWEKFDDNCKGCKPAMMDLRTKKVLPDDSPEMKAIFEVWDKTTLEERQAYHNFCCNNSRDEKDISLVTPIMQKIEEVLKALAKKANDGKS